MAAAVDATSLPLFSFYCMPYRQLYFVYPVLVSPTWRLVECASIPDMTAVLIDTHGLTLIDSIGYSSYLEGYYWPCAGRLSAVSAIGRQVTLVGTDSMAVGGIDGHRRGKREERA